MSTAPTPAPAIEGAVCPLNHGEMFRCGLDNKLRPLWWCRTCTRIWRWVDGWEQFGKRAGRA